MAAFPTYRSRGAIRDLGKALALPQARSSDGQAGRRVGRHRRVDAGWRRPGAAGSPRWRAFAFLMEQIMGMPRHISQHSGGMVISTPPLVELVPVIPAAMEGRLICQWDKDSCADAGFLKIDLLGLGMLSAVEECVDLIAETRGEPVDLSRVGFDDPEVYAEIQAADTVGVFQIESRAQMQSLQRTLPENLDDLTVQVALVRPGPIVGDAVNPYVKHRQRAPRRPRLPAALRPSAARAAAGDTLGVVVFQDQVLEVAIALAGFTTGEAEGLRRAMSRKRSRPRWSATGTGSATARRRWCRRGDRPGVFEKVVAFSEFGFPKCHAAAFAILAYQSAWLHRTYPAEFLCALLNAQPMGFYPPSTLLRDGERRGVRSGRPTSTRSWSPAHRGRRGGADRPGLRQGRRRTGRGAGRRARRRGRTRTWRPGAPGAAGMDRSRPSVRAPADDSPRPPPAAVGDPPAPRPRARARAPAGAGPGRLPAAGAAAHVRPGTGWSPTTRPMGLTTGRIRWRCCAQASMPRSSPRAGSCARRYGRVTVAGMTIARQRPAHAKGIVFLLLEDEHG